MLKKKLAIKESTGWMERLGCEVGGGVKVGREWMEARLVLLR